MKMNKSRLLISFAFVLMLVLLAVNALAITETYNPQTGSDDTTLSPHPGHHLLTSSELDDVNSDNNISYRNNESWYSDYIDTEYIDWVLNGNIPSQAGNIRTFLTMDWKRNTAVDEARIMLWVESEGTWSPVVTLIRPPTPMVDYTQTIDITDYINTAEDVNNLVFRFQAKDVECTTKSCEAWTHFDFIQLEVRYDNSTPDTNVTYFTRDDGSNKEYCFWDDGQGINVAYVNFDGDDIVTNGFSKDTESNLADVAWVRGWEGELDSWTDYWQRAEYSSGNSKQKNWSTSRYADDWPENNFVKVCGSATDVADEKENNMEVGQLVDVSTIPEDDCCWLCIDRINPSQPGMPEHYDQDICELADENLFDNDNYLEFLWEASTDNPDCSGIDYYNVEVYEDDVLVENTTSSTNSYAYNNGVHGSYYKIRVQAVDMAGNEGLWSEFSAQVLVDTEEPTMTITPETPHELPNWYNSDFSVLVELEDLDSGLCTCTYEITDLGTSETRTESEDCFCNEMYNFTAQITVGEEGDCSTIGIDTCSIYVSAEDKAGNIADDYEYFSIDYLPPETTKTVGIPKIEWNDIWSWRGWSGFLHFFLKDTTKITLSCNDQGSDGIGCNETYFKQRYYDGTSWTEWSEWQVYDDSSDIYLEDGDGVYDLEYYSVDLLGNTEDVQVETDKVDTESPETTKYIGQPSYQNGYYITSNTLMYLTGVDEEVGCEITGWIMSDETHPIRMNEPQGCNETVGWGGLDDGIYTIEFRSIDSLENVEEATIQDHYLDNTPPEIEILNPFNAEEIGCQMLTFDVLARITDQGVGVIGGAYGLLLDENGSVIENITLQTFGNGLWVGSFSNLVDAGDYEVKVVAWDVLENEGYSSVDVTMFEDVYWEVAPSQCTIDRRAAGNCSFDYRITTCHGGDTIAMAMHKLCCSHWLHPELDNGTTTVPVEELWRIPQFFFGGEVWENFENLIGYCTGPSQDVEWNEIQLSNYDPETRTGDITLDFGTTGPVSGTCSYLYYAMRVNYSDGTEPINNVPHMTYFTITWPNTNVVFTPVGPTYAECGNGIVESGEQCDGTNLLGQSCSTLEYDAGSLSCTNTCRFEESGCYDNPEPPINPPSGGSGGGGSGGGGSSYTCTPNWICGPYNACVAGFKTRSCYDQNHCNTNLNQPEEITICSVSEGGSEEGTLDTQLSGLDSGTPNFFDSLTGFVVKDGDLQAGGITIGALVLLALVLAVILTTRTKVTQKANFWKKK